MDRETEEGLGTIIVAFGLIIFTTLCFRSCVKDQEIAEEKRAALPNVEKVRVLNNKRIEKVDGTAFDRGYENYRVSFSDGYSKTVSFGTYNMIQIGDSITFIKKKGDRDYMYKMKLK